MGAEKSSMERQLNSESKEKGSDPRKQMPLQKRRRNYCGVRVSLVI